MIRHVVMWRMKEDKKSEMEEMKKRLEALPGKIEQIRHLEVGINSKESPAAYDIVLISDFANEEELQSYAKHPLHQEVVSFINQVTAERAVVDYERAD